MEVDRDQGEPQGPPPLWLVDWSDSEDADFAAACSSAGVVARVLRGRELGPSVGRRLHRARSWPTYASLAVRGLRRARGAPLVAWQPLAGCLAALARVGTQPPILLLNPILDAGSASRLQRIAITGARRADRILFSSRAILDQAAALGLPREQLGFVPLGVRAAPAWAPPRGSFVLAFGREARDWTTLARAAAGLPCEVVVVGPDRVEGADAAALKIRPQVDRRRLHALIADARAIAVPLARTTRVAGQLAVLDAMAVGRPVVATRAPGTEDYVRAETGILVPPGDPAALREGLQRVLDGETAERLGRAAHAAAQGPFSLERFVTAVDAEARGLT